MRRYRIMPGSFDTRSHFLSQEIPTSWEPTVRASHWSNHHEAIRSIAYQYGEGNLGQKLAAFTALGAEPFSVLAYHNYFFRQARNAYVVGSYFPALTGACALGERILNHLVRNLRDEFKGTVEYKRVYRKQSFDNWNLAIDVLVAWEVLLPNVVSDLTELVKRRNDAIHFRPETDQSARELALDAITILSRVIDGQFGANPPKPWYMKNTPGETYIRGEAESLPFVKRVILPSPSAIHVGPMHELKYDQETGRWLIDLVGDAGDAKGTDAEFLALHRGEKNTRD